MNESDPMGYQIDRPEQEVHEPKRDVEPVTVIPVVTLTRICMVKKYDDDRFIRREVDALVWDPNVVRALLDERVYRNPMVALIAPQSERKG